MPGLNTSGGYSQADRWILMNEECTRLQGYRRQLPIKLDQEKPGTGTSSAGEKADVHIIVI